MTLVQNELPGSFSSSGQEFASIFETSDAANGTSTQYSMSAGDTFQGNLSSSGDRDWVAINLEAGQTYEIDLAGSTSGGGTLSDPYLRLHDSSGSIITLNDDSGGTLDSFLTFTAITTGTYYINAGAFADNKTGTYTISVEQVPTPEPATLDELANYLTDGYWEDTGRAGRSFDTTSDNVITVNLTGLTAEGRQLARWALDAWETVTNLEFAETVGTADILFDDADSGAYSTSDTSGSVITSSFVNVSTNWLNTYGTSIDSYSYQTYVHEIGHALGLGHQSNYNGSATYGVDNDFVNDSWQLSIMSYFSQTENTYVNASYSTLLTPMMADIIAIQNLYGAPGQSSATAGDTVWGPGSNLAGALGEFFSGDLTHYTGNNFSFTIYDQGGTDTLDASRFDAGDRIDMRASHFSDVAGLIGNVGIAEGTIVENLITGDGNDTVRGNHVANDIRTNGGHDEIQGGGGSDVLNGGGGQDTLFGGGGHDQLLGGHGRDRTFGGAGNDRLYGRQGNDRLVGNDGNDRLFGGAGNDTLLGGRGNDRLTGNGGDDLFTGGAGADVFIFASNHGNDRITDFSTSRAGECIKLSGLSALENFDDILTASTQTADGVLIYTGNNSSILLENVQLSSLSADDFIF
ncbi:M10 family metallopeptidase C-terminal domain-containing protein [Leisingera sp. ANG59]|uniref:M10 family metallopeptidase C-terminal domain-containing protein n=1 Tax=Leisingera sp. ANG59 TaxID=2675221 RepID=UPI001571C472|nr:M10 family metallopeptidase C-terminal domain-containing protein [Leisingera sp. ANG59]NSY37281.1 matrixin family metalloprotease [Leisingera sp. ANG59]